MNSDILIPKDIQVGFRKRKGTFTGELAYVIYYDEKGKLRKERSWDSWRDKSIEPKKFSNEPTSGFVLNKKVGGYSTGWNHRNTYTRIYDPRGFEFEITMENLLYILENTNSIKGKGLEGDFVYGWAKGDHILIPTSSPDYEEILKFNEYKYNPKQYKGKDLKVGATYLHKDNKELIYVGRFEYFEYGSKDKRYFFYDPKGVKEWKWVDGERFPTSYGTWVTIKTLTRNIVDTINEDCSYDYANILDSLYYEPIYSPIDRSKDEFIPYTYEEFEEKIQSKIKKNYNRWNCLEVFASKANIEIPIYYDSNNSQFYREKGYTTKNWRTEVTKEYYDSILDMYNKLSPKYKVKYLKNGNKYKEYK